MNLWCMSYLGTTEIYDYRIKKTKYIRELASKS